MFLCRFLCDYYLVLSYSYVNVSLSKKFIVWWDFIEIQIIIYLHAGVHRFSKNLGLASRFWVPER
jgi:hypothetical protein